MMHYAKKKIVGTMTVVERSDCECDKIEENHVVTCDVADVSCDTCLVNFYGELNIPKSNQSPQNHN